MKNRSGLLMKNRSGLFTKVRAVNENRSGLFTKVRAVPTSVILAEPSRTAFGGTTGFGGNPEEQRQPPVGHVHINNNKMVRRSPSLSGLPSDGLEDRNKSENNTLFYWIPPATRGQARE